MAKKSKTKASKKSEPTDMIHFRPGPELGSLVGQLADELTLSRGEISKRMTALAIRGLDLSCYGLVDELAMYFDAGMATFDQSAQFAYVTVYELAEESNCEVYELPREQIHDRIKRVVELYKSFASTKKTSKKNELRSNYSSIENQFGVDMNESVTIQLPKNSVNEKLVIEEVLAALHDADVEYLKIGEGLHCVEALRTVLALDGKRDMLRFQCEPGLRRFFRPASEHERIAYGLPSGAIAVVEIDEEGYLVTRYGVPDNA